MREEKPVDNTMNSGAMVFYQNGSVVRKYLEGFFAVVSVSVAREAGAVERGTKNVQNGRINGGTTGLNMC